MFSAHLSFWTIRGRAAFLNNVVWSNRALKSLADIHQQIALNSQRAANEMVDTILKIGDQLATFSKLGREIDRYNRACIVS